MEITVKGVRKAFGKLRALDDVYVDIKPGQIVALLGPNGAGKTTLMRILSGVSVPDRGEILYDGETFVRDRLDLRCKLMFLPDAPAAYAQMSPIKHIAMMLRLYGVNPEGIETKVTELFKELDMLPYANIPLSCLSRGQLYKSVLAPLLAADPELWLLDEPFASGMDPNGIAMFKKCARAARDQGRTVIYSTQIVEVNENFCDRVCVIHKGRVEAFCTMDELKSRVGSNDALAELFRQLREEHSETP